MEGNLIFSARANREPEFQSEMEFFNSKIGSWLEFLVTLSKTVRKTKN